MSNTPTKEGFYWGKWLTACPGTRDYENGGDVGSYEREVMHVVVNTLDTTDPEHLMVMVPGVEKWQGLDSFEWGDEVQCLPGS